ncbi:MAG: hypothetical protein RR614_13785, partial [Eubacterium sp.]
WSRHLPLLDELLSGKMGVGGTALALVNLLLAALTAALALYAFIFKKNRKLKAVFIAALSILLFIGVEPFVWRFIWIDKWTMLFVLLLMAEAGIVLWKKKGKKEEEDQIEELS